MGIEKNEKYAENLRLLIKNYMLYESKWQLLIISSYTYQDKGQLWPKHGLLIQHKQILSKSVILGNSLSAMQSSVLCSTANTFISFLF